MAGTAMLSEGPARGRSAPRLPTGRGHTLDAAELTRFADVQRLTYEGAEAVADLPHCRRWRERGITEFGARS